MANFNKINVFEIGEELKEVEEILDNIMPVLKEYLTEDMAELINNKIFFIEE